MKNKTLLVFLLSLLIVGLYAGYTQRAIQDSDQIQITDVNGKAWLNKWSQVKTFTNTATGLVSYIAAVDTVTTDSASVYRTMSTTFTNTIASEFTKTDSGFVYTGTDTKWFDISWFGYYVTDKDSCTITTAIQENDVLNTTSDFGNYIVEKENYGVAIGCLGIELETDDRVELVISSSVDTTAVIYPYFAVKIKKLY